MKWRKKIPPKEWVVVRCLHCTAPVSNPVQHFPDATKLKLADGRVKALVPKGFYVLRSELPEGYSRKKTGETVLLNLQDVKETKPGGIRIGCCGVDGLDGNNTFCFCGQPLGTEVSDCWTKHYLDFDLENIELEEVEQPAVSRSCRKRDC